MVSKKILFPVAECEPFAKTGGLADVASALPIQIVNNSDYDIRVIMPFYTKVEEYFENHPNLAISTVFEDQEISFDKFYHGMKKVYSFNVYQSTFPDNQKVIIYFIDIPEFFNRENLYVDEKSNVFPDSAEMFGYFTKAVFEFLNLIDWSPEILHCHDWHTGLIPLFIKHDIVKLKAPVKTILTIHNMAYQGTFHLSYAEKFGLTVNEPLMEDLVIYEKMNFLKAGIVCSDIVSTVSEKYRDELLTEEYGAGLQAFLEARKETFFGILNGVDYESWDPERDKYISSNYSSKNLNGKVECKLALWELIRSHNKNFKLDNPSKPIFAMVSRLDRQKGIDLVAQAIKNLDENKNNVSEKLHIVVVGSGNKKLEALLVELSNLPFFTLIRGFSNQLAHTVEAGADFFLMPSKYEPCGLNQMYSLKYGTIPIVRNTGGLADTVTDLEDEINGNGFVFDEYSADKLTKAILRAFKFYNTTKPQKIDELRVRGMVKDFSWGKSVKKYLELYQKE